MQDLVEYRLTPHGRQLGPVSQALWDWGADAPTQQATPLTCPFVDTKSPRKIPTLPRPS
ncbi:winged helix-turn-helix transcriptional regulator [Streptomyces sp. HUAS TT7]|uniref:winged helix-turn-helix transcriptional regulator n=1 Tax=Streptomyces sp. HUAS TT7 TaxID=3447507 RepID=UPI003F654B5E